VRALVHPGYPGSEGRKNGCLFPAEHQLASAPTTHIQLSFSIIPESVHPFKTRQNLTDLQKCRQSLGKMQLVNCYVMLLSYSYKLMIILAGDRQSHIKNCKTSCWSLDRVELTLYFTSRSVNYGLPYSNNWRSTSSNYSRR